MSQILPNIDHVVVLMLENRSFDNLFGGLYPAGPDFFGLTGQESNYNPEPPGVGTWKVWQAPVGGSSTTMPYPDPGEEFTDMNTQLFGTPSPPACAIPTMSGFAANYARQPASRWLPFHPSVKPEPRDIMQYFQAGNVPVSNLLARVYAVSDVWYAAAPVQTISNRTFVHTGTASLKPGTTNEARVNNGDYTAGLSFANIIEGNFHPPVEDTTVFELLDKANPAGKAPSCTNWQTADQKLNWKVYYHDAPLSALCAYVYANWCFTSLYGGNVFGFASNFASDIANGILPTYSFIEPAYTSVEYTANCNHPGGSKPDPLDLNAQNFPPPIDVKDGEILLADVYSALSAYPEVFERTLLIVTYDEHGGLYDHMQPGPAVSPFADPATIFNYDRYGVRVPAILINPRVGTKVFRPSDGVQTRNACGPLVTQLDHTSIIRTLCQQFGLGDPPTPRAQTAATLSGLVLPQADATPEPPKEVMDVAAEARAARRVAARDPGKTARIRTWFGRRKIDGFPGDHLNNAVFALFATSWYGRQRSASYPLREIADLDADAADRLLASDIRDTQSLLATIRAPGGVAKVAAAAGEDALQVLTWEAEADLLRVPGILGDDAYLLVAIGVRSPAELASRGASGLRSRLLKLAARIELADYRLPLKVVAGWVSAAKGVADASARSATGG